MGNRKVFVLNKGSHDYSAAWDFGDLVFCTSGPVNRKDFNTMYNEVHKAMDCAEVDDFILLSSLTSLCCVACGIFANRFACLNLLVYENGEYLERHLTLDN